MFTEALADFICKTNYENLPPELIARAKPAVLDHLAVAMSGSREPSGRMVAGLVREQQSIGEATVIGNSFKASCPLAALVNGNSSHSQDFDDCLDFPGAGLAHPSTGILPAVLALAEKNRLSGKDVLTAYCLGVEAYGKIGLLVNEVKAGREGWEPTGILGVIGAAAAVAKLLGLDRRRTMMTLGIASSMSCGLIRNFGSMAGHIHAGNAARHGIEAGLLALKGYTATCPGIIEGPNGFYNAFSARSGPAPLESQQKLIEALGDPWNLVDPGLMFKAYPCAHISHFGAYGGLMVREKYNIDWRQIDSIEFRVPRIMESIAFAPHPEDGVQGRFSLVYCLCRALIHGEIDFSFFTDEAVRDENTNRLIDKVNWVFMDDDAAGPFANQEVSVRMKDGAVYSFVIDHPKGEPQNPQTPDELDAKYRKCGLYGGYSEATIDQVQKMVTDLENVADVSSLMGLFGN